VKKTIKTSPVLLTTGVGGPLNAVIPQIPLIKGTLNVVIPQIPLIKGTLNVVISKIILM
jgi:hypothetical protein